MWRGGKKYGLADTNVFHAGDGNLHPLILFDWRNAEQKARVMKRGWRSSSSASTSAAPSAAARVGLERSTRCGNGFSRRRHPQPVAVKQAFDPKDLANPGKMFPKVEEVRHAS